VITADDIGDVHSENLHHCPRQLWLYGRGFRPEQRDDLAQLGEAVNDTSYTRRSPVDLGAARLDFLDGQHWVHEMKSSSRPTSADVPTRGSTISGTPSTRIFRRASSSPLRGAAT
jgi:CRISPR-associated exonuclease Cas4